MLEDDTMARAAAALEDKIAADGEDEEKITVEDLADEVAEEEEAPDEELEAFLKTVPKGGK